MARPGDGVGDRGGGVRAPAAAKTQGRADGGVDRAVVYATDAFRMTAFKVLLCSNRQPHDWKRCPFAHPGEHARRRPLDTYSYCAEMCPHARHSLPCPRGDTCPFSHHVFEMWLHPERYKTTMCVDGADCKRRVCFFAHSAAELRAPTPSSTRSTAAPPLNEGAQLQSPTAGTCSGGGATTGGSEVGSPLTAVGANHPLSVSPAHLSQGPASAVAPLFLQQAAATTSPAGGPAARSPMALAPPAACDASTMADLLQTMALQTQAQGTSTGIAQQGHPPAVLTQQLQQSPLQPQAAYAALSPAPPVGFDATASMMAAGSYQAAANYELIAAQGPPGAPAGACTTLCYDPSSGLVWTASSVVQSEAGHGISQTPWPNNNVGQYASYTTAFSGSSGSRTPDSQPLMALQLCSTSGNTASSGPLPVMSAPLPQRPAYLLSGVAGDAQPQAADLLAMWLSRQG